MRWAKIDAATGAIRSHGSCAERDVAKQKLAPGEAIAERPDHVTSLEPWRLIGGEWIKDQP